LPHALFVTMIMALCSAGCDGSIRAANADTEVCRIVMQSEPLPRAVRETSGIAVSAHDPGVLWTHNDRGNDAVIFAFGEDGTLRTRVAVTGANLIDWEDIESAPCAAGTCLYIADIGDNSGAREGITIYVVAEPPLAAESTQPARALHARYPDGPHNAEGLFALPGGDLFIMTKGDDGPIALYRYPAAARADSTVTLERIRDVDLRRGLDSEVVTAATASADGKWIAVRTYTTLHFFVASALTEGTEVEPLTFDLRPLGESQGEGLTLANDGTVWLTSEAEGEGMPQLSKLTCTLGGGSDQPR
jgi:hypothetical protein